MFAAQLVMRRCDRRLRRINRDLDAFPFLMSTVMGYHAADVRR